MTIGTCSSKLIRATRVRIVSVAAPRSSSEFKSRPPPTIEKERTNGVKEGLEERLEEIFGQTWFEQELIEEELEEEIILLPQQWFVLVAQVFVEEALLRQGPWNESSGEAFRRNAQGRQEIVEQRASQLRRQQEVIGRLGFAQITRAQGGRP